ncbi:hypothetical protein EMPS_06865 [Entomortierella parvispora]|uniref:F-box domain-containing protein n=1 Tax=Entomortierella parvispora TaxID=205924 RepID=A0A9P3HDT1_9FUNG|nr:hypothetical protein EMPS_06865 [Entomortierella parvispora]
MEIPPEIILCIGQSLSHRDLRYCIRINKTWHNVLTSILYRSVDEIIMCKPSLNSLNKYMHLIQDAKVIVEGPYMSQITNRSSILNLRCLCLYVKEDTVFTSSTSDIFKFIPHLSSLSVKDARPLGKNFPLQSILGGFPPSLKELHLDSAYLSMSTLQLIVNPGLTLEKLSLIHCEIDINDSFELFDDADIHPRLPNISSLRFSCRKGLLDLGAWLKNCPNTRILQWYSGSTGMGVPILGNRILSVEAPRWSRIQSLSLYGDNRGGKLAGDLLSLILDACAPLTKICISHSGFSIKSFFSLERHFSTLEHLGLTYIEGVQSWMSQSVLSSCPRLVHFDGWVLLGYDLIHDLDAEAQRKQASDLYFITMTGDLSQQGKKMDPVVRKRYFARDIRQVRPWVCHGLTTLRVAIAETKPQWQESIFKRISTLTELRELDISRHHGSFRGDSLDLRLISGLGHLDSLTHLEALYYSETPQFMEACDVQWMLDAWPNLRNLNWEFNEEPKKNDELSKIVERHFWDTDEYYN